MKRITSFWIRTGDWIAAHKVRFFVLCGVAASLIILALDYRNGFDWQGIQVEAHGLLFDVILFGVLLSLYEVITDKRERKQRYQEEIEDYLGWDSKEAMYRIVGNIKRLNRAGKSDINLFNANLEEAKLVGINLEGAHLMGANLQGAKLGEANLKGAKLWEANLQRASLRRANLQGAKLAFVKLDGADFWEAKLEGATAFESAREAFAKVMSQEQLAAIEWGEDLEWPRWLRG